MTVCKSISGPRARALWTEGRVWVFAGVGSRGHDLAAALAFRRELDAAIRRARAELKTKGQG